MYGVWDAPYAVAVGTANVISSGPFSASGIIMGNGNTTGALPNGLCQTTMSNTSGSLALAGTALNSCVTEVTASTTSFNRRNNNTVQYWSPVVSGLQFKLATAVANYQSPADSPGAIASGTQKPKYLSGNVTWARGPLALAAAYESHEGFRPSTVATGIANPKDTGFQFGAKWNFGPGQVGVGIETLSYGNNAAGTTAAPNNAIKLPAQVINGRWNLGPGAVWASLSKTPGGKSCNRRSATDNRTAVGTVGFCGAGGEAKMTVLGYDYVMSKRTKMYFAYAKIDNGLVNVGGTTPAMESSNYFYIAGPAGNSTNGTAGGNVAGTDTTTLAFGIQHTF
jgi:predicted porin